MPRRQQHKKLALWTYGKARYAGNPDEDFYKGWVCRDLGGDSYDFLHADDGASNQPDISRNVHASHIVVFDEKDQVAASADVKRMKPIKRTKQKQVEVLYLRTLAMTDLRCSCSLRLETTTTTTTTTSSTMRRLVPQQRCNMAC